MTYVIGGADSGSGGYVIGGGGQQKKPGYGLNPLTDFSNATTSIGDWINKRTNIGGLNLGIGSALSTVTNIIPGLANLGVKSTENLYTGLAHGNWDPMVQEGKAVGGAFEHGALDTMTDVMTLGGAAPWTNWYEKGVQGESGYKPSSLKQYATSGTGEGFLGGALNDTLNLLPIADGAGALARTGEIGKVAELARSAEAVGKVAGVDAGAAAADISGAGTAAREAQIQAAAERAAAATGGDPGTIAERIRARARLQDNIDTAKHALSAPLAPWRALRPLGRAAGLERGATPLGDLGQAGSLPGASEGTLQPATVRSPLEQMADEIAKGERVKQEAAANAPVPEGMVRLYNGGTGDQSMWTDSQSRAQSYVGEGALRHVDVPADQAAMLKTEPGSEAYRKATEAGHQPVPNKDYYLGDRQNLISQAVEHPVEAAKEPSSFISDQAKAYNQEHGLPEPKPTDLTAKVDPVRGRIIAELYARAQSDPSNPAVVKSYTAFARDVVKQWQFLKQQGVTVDFVDRQGAGAYPDAQAMIGDVKNGHLFVDRTGPGEEHLMPHMNAVIDHDAAGNPITTNDAFRAVHDYFGHADATNDFGRSGEDVAWNLHRQMFSPEAQGALFTETVGQNSVLNFSPANVELKRSGLTPSFPDQKATILPELVRQPDWRPAGPGVADSMATSLPRPEGVPAAYKSYFERTTPPPRWATAAVARLPQPIVNLLAWTDDLRMRHEYTTMQRQSVRVLGVEARRIENTPEIQALRAKAEELVAARVPGITPSVASDIVGERVFAHLTFGPLWEHMETLRPEVDAVQPGLTDQILHFSSDLPPEVNTPEFRNEMRQLADPIKQLRQEAAERLKASSFLGERGLENIDSDVPVLTAKETRALGQARKFINEAGLLELKQIPKELEAANAEIARTLDAKAELIRSAQLAQETGEAALDQIDRSRTYVPLVFRDPNQMSQVLTEMAGKILTDQGATLDPHSGEYLETGSKQGYLVGAAKQTAARIPLTGNAAVDQAAIAQALDAVARTYQNAFQFPDIVLGAWVDNGVAHIDPTQFLEGQSQRDYALVLAAAREQESMMELHTGDIVPNQYDPNVAVQFLDKHAGRDARANEFRRIADQQAANYKPGGPVPISQDDIDRHMAFLDMKAIQEKQAGRIQNADDFYRQSFKSEYAKRESSSALALNEIRPMIQDPGKLKAIARGVLAKGTGEGRWYYDAHDYIDKAGTQMGPVDLGMSTPWSAPKTVDGRELLYDMMAVHSMNTDPAQNFIWGLGSVRNWVGANKSGMKELADAVKEWVGLPQERRTPLTNSGYVPKLVKLLGEDTNQLARRYYLAILDGHTVDSWDADFFRPGGAFENYGNVGEKKLLENKIPAKVTEELGREKGVMEWHGSNAAAKIRSFRDNLRNPETSMSVTLDSWMARLFGPGDTFWGAQGRWYHYADMIRGIASDLSDETGRKVMPHEVQASLWFWAKDHYANINSAMTRANGIEVMRQIGSGTWTRDTDPMGQFWADAEAQAKTSAPHGAEAAPLTKIRTTKAAELGPETVEAGAKLPKTAEAEVNYRAPRATSKGGITVEGNSIIQERLRYGDVMDQIEKHMNAGNEEEARYAIWNYVNQSDKEWEGRKAGLQFWDAPSRPSFHEFNQTLADVLGIHIADGPLPEEFRGELLGQFVPRPATASGTIRLFQSANFTTLFHESGHLIRSLTSGDDLAMLERQYGVRGGKWGVEAEEKFVHDMIASASGVDTGPAAPALGRLKETLARLYEPFGQTYDAGAVHPEIANFWSHLLAPEMTRLDEAQLPGTEVAPGTKLIGYQGELPNEAMTKTPGQRVANPPKFAVDQSPNEMYRRGVQGQEALDQWRQQLIRKREALAAADRAGKHVEELQKVINDRMLPGQLAAAGLRDKATALVDKVAEGIEDPSMRRVPPAFQPLVRAGKDIADAVEQYPELETILETMPKTFGDALDYAKANGWDPTFMPELTPARVRQMVNGTVRLGQPGKEFVSGGRQIRSGALRSADLFDQSIESVIAGLNHAVQEDRTNLIVDWIDRVASTEVPRNDQGLRVIPRSMVAWDPIRRGMLSVENTGGDVQALGATRMIPRAVANAITEYQSGTSNPFFRAMAKVTNPWRAAMLTWNPNFYQRHFIGHVVLAGMNEGGLNIRDWLKARDAMKEGYVNLPEVTGMSITQSELGQPGIVRYPSMGDAMAQGGPRAAVGYIGDKLHRAINVSDSFARAVVYFSDIRKGVSPMEAMQHSMDALVDYGDLSNTERYFARAIIPFYGFEKGVLKIAMKMPFDHPLTSAILMKVGQYQGEQAVDDQGNPLPERYQTVVNIGGAKIDFRSYTPFKDVGALVTPEGLVGSLQFAIQAVVRSGLGDAAPFTKSGVKVNQYGQVVPDVSVASQLVGAATSSPQGSLIAGLQGATSKSPAQSAANFFGLPIVNNDTLSKAGARNVLSTAEVANATPQQAQKATAFPVDTNALQNAVSVAQGSGGLQLPDVPGAPTQQQVQASLAAAQQKQQAASAAARATKPRSGGGSHRVSSGRVRLTSAHRASAHISSHRSRGTRAKLRQGFAKAAKSGSGGGSRVGNNARLFKAKRR